MKLKNFLLLLLLAALWGPSFLFMKVAVAEVPPLTLVVGRVGIGALLLYLFLRGQGRRLPAWGPIWGHITLVALFHNSMPFVLISWAEQYIDSALASIINGTTPIFTLIIAHFLTQDDRLTPLKMAGIGLGLGGMALLAAPALVAGVQATTLGLLAMVIVSASYGFALVYARKHLVGLPPLVAPTGQLIAGTVLLVPLALIFDRPWQLTMPSLPAAASIMGLAVLGTALAFIVYYRLMASAAASYVSMVTYLVPIFGIILGVLVLDEQMTWNAYAGFALILLGVMIVNGAFNGVMRRTCRWRRAGAGPG